MLPASVVTTPAGEREGHARIPRKHVEEFDGDIINLGIWVQSRRGEFRRGSLSAERVAELEAIPGWQWGTKNETDADQQMSLDWE